MTKARKIAPEVKKSIMRALWSKLKAPLIRSGDKQSEPLFVDRPAIYIGDIHGCSHLLDALTKILECDPVRSSACDMVFLGDYVDRGENSRTVLQSLYELDNSGPSVTCLMGNHELMMLKFISDPVRGGARWLKHGGLQTLASFGVGLQDGTREPAMIQAAKDLEAVMGQPMIDWVSNLPLMNKNGNLYAVHAAADPNLPMPLQDKDVLLWGHESFATIKRDDGMRCIHGHTIRPTPEVSPAGHISLDTGAYATGVLSAAIVEPGSPDPRFIST